jgi:methyl-accepting chemotaxis protein
VRKLSEQSEKMVQDVGQRIQMLEQKMDEVIAQTNINANGPEELAQNSNKTMSLYERFRMLALSLSKSSEILLVESSNIKNEINEILVALQYQDKTSQILIHVTDDVEALIAFLEKNKASNVFSRLDVENWLQKLYATYTMVEEKHAHSGEQQDFAEPQEDSGSLEFF